VDVLAILEKAVPPVVTGAIGVAGSVWRLQKGLKNSIAAIGAKLETYKVATDGALRDIRKSIRELKATFRFELDHNKAELDETIAQLESEIEDAKRNSHNSLVEDATHQQKFTDLSRRIDELKESVKELEKAQSNFSKEQQIQWNEMNRTMGEIRGALRRTQS
jgi:DNA repair exonuclease SbcCD ATPase subunit